MATRICCLCFKDLKGRGNNAEPLKIGVCCDKCNFKQVMPARMKAMQEMECWLVETHIKNCKDCQKKFIK